MINRIKGNVTAAKGFYAAHTAAKIKYKDREDMALIYSKEPCQLAATFTQNVVKAAPVLWDRSILEKEKKAQAIVVNAGIANACTGEGGLAICRQSASHAGELLSISKEHVLVASTGVIGMDLPLDRICAGIDAMVPALANRQEAGLGAAKAIMTTDTHPKELALSVNIAGQEVRLGGISKGSGMIHPNMCTMLCFLTTDCAIEQELLQKALSSAVNDSFNMISVDQDTSTNDTCLLLANGLAGNAKITEEGEDYELFASALRELCQELARQMAEDGEGASCLIEVQIEGARSQADARTLAKSVISSSLTKAAVYGHDANWGRVLCALGYAGVDFDPNRVDLYFASDKGELQLVKDGFALDYSEERATEILMAKKVIIRCDMKSGEEKAVAWGCDLTHEYVTINADYRS